MRTTHVGSLPRPAPLTEALRRSNEGGDDSDVEELASEAVREVVRREAEVGLDILNDGEQAKWSYATYVQHRLAGFAGEPTSQIRDDRDDFPDFWAERQVLPGASNVRFPMCNGPVALRAPDAVHRDIARLQAAAAAAGVGADRLFMTAASPGLIASVFGNDYYPDQESYLVAVAEAIRDEYRAIVGAGITLQLDCPDLAGSYSWTHKRKTVEQFRAEATRSIEILDAATAGLPPELLRLHVCWGNSEGPHVHDIALADVVDLLLRARPAGLSFEAANPRHAHEWRIFEELRLPDDKYLIPGVIDTTTNFVEHPELVAQRLLNFGRLVGAERVVAGVDCGFATFAGPKRVATSVTWAKLESLVVGAAAASAALGA